MKRENEFEIWQLLFWRWWWFETRWAPSKSSSFHLRFMLLRVASVTALLRIRWYNSKRISYTQSHARHFSLSLSSVGCFFFCPESLVLLLPIAIVIFGVSRVECALLCVVFASPCTYRWDCLDVLYCVFEYFYVFHSFLSVKLFCACSLVSVYNVLLAVCALFFFIFFACCLLKKFVWGIRTICVIRFANHENVNWKKRGFFISFIVCPFSTCTTNTKTKFANFPPFFFKLF